MRVFLRELFFARTNFRGKFSNYFFQFSPERISTKETSFKYFARIKFHKFHEKHILPLAIFFRMRLNASVHKASQIRVKETELSIRRFQVLLSYDRVYIQPHKYIYKMVILRELLQAFKNIREYLELTVFQFFSLELISCNCRVI